MGWIEDSVDDFRSKLHQVNRQLDGYSGPGCDQLREFVDSLFGLLDAAVVGISEPVVIPDVVRTLASLQQGHADVHQRLKSHVATLGEHYVPLPTNDVYFPVAARALADMNASSDIFSGLHAQHEQLLTPLEALWVARLVLIGALVALAWTLGSLLVTALLDAPVAVPAAAVEVGTGGGAAGTIMSTLPPLLTQVGGLINFALTDTEVLALTGLMLADGAALTWTFNDPSDAEAIVALLAATAAALTGIPIAITTSHQISITLVGGGASSGGQTVVVNGDGTGYDVGGLSISDQETQALKAAWACDDARAERLADPNTPKKEKGNFNFAIGFLSLNGGTPEVDGPKLGTGGPDTHSEQLIVDDWKILIPTLGAKPGSHLVLLIFTRNQMCGTCQNMVPIWSDELAVVAGPGLTIHFYLWESQDQRSSVGPNNIQPVP